MTAAFPSPSASGAPDGVDLGGLLRAREPDGAVPPADGGFEALELWGGTAGISGSLRDVGAGVKAYEALDDDGNYNGHESSLLQFDVINAIANDIERRVFYVLWLGPPCSWWGGFC
eukprot:12413988-Heterocapsa_arctica.AAC.1